MFYHYKDSPGAWNAENFYYWITGTKAQPELNLRVHNAESNAAADFSDKVVQQLSQMDALPPAEILPAANYSQEPTHSPSMLIPGSQSRSSNGNVLVEGSPHRGPSFRAELMPGRSSNNSHEPTVEPLPDASAPRTSENMSHPATLPKKFTASTTSGGRLELKDGRFLVPRSRPNSQRSRSNGSQTYQFDKWNVLYGVVGFSMVIAVSCYGYSCYRSNDKSNEGSGSISTDVKSGIKSETFTETKDKEVPLAKEVQKSDQINLEKEKQDLLEIVDNTTSDPIVPVKIQPEYKITFTPGSGTTPTDIELKLRDSTENVYEGEYDMGMGAPPKISVEVLPEGDFLFDVAGIQCKFTAELGDYKLSRCGNFSEIYGLGYFKFAKINIQIGDYVLEIVGEGDKKEVERKKLSDAQKKTEKEKIETAALAKKKEIATAKFPAKFPEKEKWAKNYKIVEEFPGEEYKRHESSRLTSDNRYTLTDKVDLDRKIVEYTITFFKGEFYFTGQYLGDSSFYFQCAFVKLTNGKRIAEISQATCEDMSYNWGIFKFIIEER